MFPVILVSTKRIKIQLCNDVCYDSATQKCINSTVQCTDVCENRCYNSATQECFHGTVCPLGQQLCLIKRYSLNRHKYNSLSPRCYNPRYEACFDNSVCDRSQACNQQCLPNNQVCVNNVTVCDVPDFYGKYETNQIQLCIDVWL